VLPAEATILAVGQSLLPSSAQVSAQVFVPEEESVGSVASHGHRRGQSEHGKRVSRQYVLCYAWPISSVQQIAACCLLLSELGRKRHV
jgi:hypothetical protein